MNDLWRDGSLIKILLLGILIAILGLAPRSKNVTVELDRFRHARDESDSRAAAEHLAGVAEQQPWHSGLWEAAGRAALAAGDAEQAGVYLARSAARGELSPVGYLAWGDADFQVGSPLTALQIWEIANSLGVFSQEILIRKADAYRLLGDDRSLIATFQELLSQPISEHHSLDKEAEINYELGLLLGAYKPESAPAYLIRAVELDPALRPAIRGLIYDIEQALSQDDPVYTLMISGRGLANQGYWELAETAFKNAVALNPGYGDAWAYLGEAIQHTSSGTDALAALEKAQELDPLSIAANTFLALYWQRQGEFELALENLETAAKIDPDNPVYLVEMGNIHALLGDLDTGQEYYRKALEKSSNEPSFRREFLEFSMKYHLNLREVALPAARQLVLVDPGNPASLNVMGELLLVLGDTLNAERFFLRVLVQDQDYDQAHLHLGELYRSQGKYDLAIFHTNRVLETSTNPETKARAEKTLENLIIP